MSYGTGLTPPQPESFPSALAQPEHAQPAPIPAAASAEQHLPVQPPKALRSGRSVSPWAFGALGLVLVALIGYFSSALGAAASIVGLVVAVIPFGIVVFATRLVDRWEPEPMSLVVFALAWGGIAAVGFALLVDYGLSMMLAPSGLRDVLRTVVQAPLVEEFGKGIGLLLVFAMARRTFDGPVDGVVYGALVGAGFAFTENIQYFATSFIEAGASGLSATFVMRGILSPFAHAMFTSLIGFALGLAARRGRRTAAALGPWLIGMAGAVLLHAFWNGSAVFTDFYSLYISLQVPLFVLFVIGIILLRREEARLTRERLGDYAEAGWFTPEEVDMLATSAGRKRGMQWASTLRGDRSGIMKTFIRDATKLAAARQRAISGRDPGAAEDEHILLSRTAAARQSLLSY